MCVYSLYLRGPQRGCLEGHPTVREEQGRVKGVPLSSGYKDRGMKEQDKLRE